MLWAELCGPTPDFYVEALPLNAMVLGTGPLGGNRFKGSHEGEISVLMRNTGELAVSLYL